MAPIPHFEIMTIGILVVAALYVCSTAALPPCVCTRNLRPVCGSDGHTYANQCLLECENHKKHLDLTVAKEGPCEPQQDLCICTLEFKPVCGTDGETYSNRCVARCQKAEIASNGACDQVKDAPAECTCTREKKPVCGTDGVTYSNDCLLNCATAKDSTLGIASQGPCSDTATIEPVVVRPTNRCLCGRNLLPVCSTEGVTFANECLLNCAGKEKLKNAACEEVATVSN